MGLSSLASEDLRFALYGGLRATRELIAAEGVGKGINASFLERLHATMRGQTARLFRRTRGGVANMLRRYPGSLLLPKTNHLPIPRRHV